MKTILLAASISAFLTVALGAFGAHALKDRLVELGTLDIFEKAVKYQIFHSLALFITAWLTSQFPSQNWFPSALAFILGIVFFSGSLYILSITGIRWLGAIIPIGGLAFLFGWLWIAIQVLKLPSNA